MVCVRWQPAGPRWDNTSCRVCGHLLIERHALDVMRNEIVKGACLARIPDEWERRKVVGRRQFES